MPKPTSEWEEDDVLSLPEGETDTFERKGSSLLDLTLPQVKEGHVLDELAKQLSAFANTGGGRIIYGLTNSGAVDNRGVTRLIKGRTSTREWLEDVIPTLTDFEIIDFNVYEIQAKANGSSLALDKSIYVIDVPDSERAPHQSKRDHIYYIRVAGKSRPAPHRIIEDIRNRARHPKLEIHDLQIQSVASGGRGPSPAELFISKFALRITLSFGLRNVGRVRSSNSCLQLSSSVPLTTMSRETTDYFLRNGDPGTLLLEGKDPIYPGMGVTFMCHVQTEATVKLGQRDIVFQLGEFDPKDVRLSFKIFADSALAREQDFQLRDLNIDRHSEPVVAQEIRDIRVRLHQHGMPPPQRVGPWS